MASGMQINHISRWPAMALHQRPDELGGPQRASADVVRAQLGAPWSQSASPISDLETQREKTSRAARTRMGSRSRACETQVRDAQRARCGVTCAVAGVALDDRRDGGRTGRAATHELSVVGGVPRGRPNPPHSRAQRNYCVLRSLQGPARPVVHHACACAPAQTEPSALAPLWVNVRT